MLGRKEVTSLLLEAVTFYFVRKLFSVHREFGIERWGRRRLDLICMNFKSEFVGIETKSCLADYRTDKKWRTYLSGHSPITKLYFAFPPSVVNSSKFAEIKAELKAEGVGILALGDDGRIKCIQNAKNRDVSDHIKVKTLVKMAWRGGESKRTVKRTRRIHIPS